MSKTQIQNAIAQLELARRFTNNLLADIDPSDWFCQPVGVPTHVAWQVGHLAFAHYALCQLRIRGRRDDDQQLVPPEFLDRFRIGSQPVSGAENNPPPAEIRSLFDAVYERSIAELSEREDEELLAEVEKPHPMFHNKLGAVRWCASHELVHAGQIALLRRLMGKAPLR